MKDSILKRPLVFSLVLLLVVAILFGVPSVLLSRRYNCVIENDGYQLSDVEVKLPDDPFVRVIDKYQEDGNCVVVFESIKEGEGYVELHYDLYNSQETIKTTLYAYMTVNKVGMIFVSGEIFDYSGFTLAHSSVMVYALILSVYFYLLRKDVQKKDYYSVKSIFYLSVSLAGLFIGVIYAVSILFSLVISHKSIAQFIILITRNLMLVINGLTIPVIGLFAIALAFSNIKLMKMEGRGFSNTLGILLAIAIFVGTVLNIYLFFVNIDKQYTTPLFTVFYSCYSSLFVYVQVLLVSILITCYQATKKEVSYDKDFIMILGCAFRKDGTLYPLLRARADKAISFWKKQYEATGNKAIFVPSGGQGSDEPMAESKAIERYLLEQGIDQELIVTEEKSTSTYENMKYSKQIINSIKANPKVVFATTNYHVYRSGLLARQLDFEVEGIGSKTIWYFWPNAVIREAVGILARFNLPQILVFVILVILSGLFGYLYTLVS